MYFAANADIYDTDERKIILALSYLRGGVVEIWAQTYLEDVMTNNMWGEWKGFQADLELAFSNKNEQRRAISELEKL